MIDSIKYELMQQIRPQSALGEPRVLRIVGHYAAEYHINGQKPGIGHSVVKLVIGWIQFLNTGEVEQAGQAAACSLGQECKYQSHSSLVKAGNRSLIGKLQRQPETLS